MSPTSAHTVDQPPKPAIGVEWRCRYTESAEPQQHIPQAEVRHVVHLPEEGEVEAVVDWDEEDQYTDGEDRLYKTCVQTIVRQRVSLDDMYVDTP